MAIILHPGIGERFSYNRRKWQIIDLKESVYTCRTIDSDKKSGSKKPVLIHTFEKNDMIKICKLK